MKIEGFGKMLDMIEKERSIPRDTIILAVESAILSATKKGMIGGDNLSVKIDDDGTVRLFARKTVVETLEDADLQILPDEALKYDAEAVVGSEITMELATEKFGRLAAQTAKQVIMQKIREAEKELSFDEFSKKQGEIVTGIVQQKEYNGYLINLGRIETVLPFSEMPQGEILRPKDRVKVFVTSVNKGIKGPMIAISRNATGLIEKLFFLEVPEISDGTLVIKNIVREPGRRTKIAVQSSDPNVSVVGTCVGHMGARIQNIVKELGNERIDIIEWKEDAKTYISNALSPAKPLKIDLNKEDMTALVTIPDSQLSLAIGKEGQNVRLASKLTGWKIDIKSDIVIKKEEVVAAPEENI